MRRVDFLKNLAFFFIAIISFHFIYLWWSGIGFKPFRDEVDTIFITVGKILFRQSDAVINLTGISHIEIKSTFYFVDEEIPNIEPAGNSPFLEVSPECTSLKQWLHWLFLMLVFPGPGKHKLWYLPTGILLLHLINVFRIVGLAIVLSSTPQYFNFYHDYFFKTLFYGSIFLMWVFWIEKVIPQESNR